MLCTFRWQLAFGRVPDTPDRSARLGRATLSNRRVEGNLAFGGEYAVAGSGEMVFEDSRGFGATVAGEGWSIVAAQSHRRRSALGHGSGTW